MLVSKQRFFPKLNVIYPLIHIKNDLGLYIHNHKNSSKIFCH